MRKLLFIALTIVLPMVLFTSTPYKELKSRTYDVCEKISEDCGGCNWPEYRHDNFNTAYTDESCSPPCDSIEQIWSYTLAPIDHILAPPSVDCGKVVFGTTTGSVYCLNAYDGTLLWSTLLTPEFVSTPTLNDKKVYVTSTSGSVYCLDIDTGAMIWMRSLTGKLVSSPKVLEGKVFFGSTNGIFYCLNAASGFTFWQYNTYNSVKTSPAVGFKRIWFTTENGFMYSLNMDNGDLVMGWPRSIANNGNASVPAYDNDFIYYSNGKLNAINAWSGMQMLNTLPNPTVVTEPAIHPKDTLNFNDSREYVGTSYNTLFKLYETARTKLWSNSNVLFKGLNNSPSITQKRVYLTSNNDIYVIDAQTGIILNRINVATPYDNEALTSIAIAYQRLYFASTSCTVYSYGCCKLTDKAADECNNAFTLMLTALTSNTPPYQVQQCCKLKLTAIVVDNCINVRDELKDKVTFELDNYQYAEIEVKGGTLTVKCNAPVGTIINVRARLKTSFLHKGQQININIVSPWLNVIVI